jgi:hypothetical protein
MLTLLQRECIVLCTSWVIGMDFNKTRNRSARFSNPGQRTDDMRISRWSSFLYTIPKPGTELGLSGILRLDTL